MKPRANAFGQQPYHHLESFDFTHYYKSLHPRLTDEHGMMFPQSSRNQWFWASFQLCIFELRYRLYHFREQVFHPQLDFPEVRWFSLPPRRQLSGDGKNPPLRMPLCVSDGQSVFTLTGAETPGAEVKVLDFLSGDTIASQSLPDSLGVKSCYLKTANLAPDHTAIFVTNLQTEILCRLRFNPLSGELSLGETSPPQRDDTESARCAGLSPNGKYHIQVSGNQFQLSETEDPTAIGYSGKLVSEETVGDLPFLRGGAFLVPRFGVPSQAKAPPLVLLTSRTTVNSITSAFLHAYDPMSGNKQTLCWSPNEVSDRWPASRSPGVRMELGDDLLLLLFLCCLQGLMTGVGYSNDGSHVFVGIHKDDSHLVFEFPVRRQS